MFPTDILTNEAACKILTPVSRHVLHRHKSATVDEFVTAEG
jgi:hypothetical protein